MANSDVVVILHGPWGVLIGADGRVTAATPEIASGQFQHTYCWSVNSAAPAPLPQGDCTLRAPGNGNLVLLDSQQVVVRKPGTKILGKPYTNLNLPSGGVCYPARFLFYDQSTITFSGKDLNSLSGRDFPHTLVLLYPGALNQASLTLPPGAIAWTGAGLQGSVILHFYAQMRPQPGQEPPPPTPTHFHAMARDFGLDLEVGGNGSGLCSSMVPCCVGPNDLLDLDESAVPRDRVFPNLITCGGAAVIYG